MSTVDGLGPYLPRLADGLLTTCEIAAASIAGAAVVAALLGVLRASRNTPARAASCGAVEFLRGTSVLVQLFWVYYALPSIQGAPRLPATLAAVLVLSLNGGAYGAEIVRSGLLAVPRGQLDACHTLGLPRRVALTRVVLPQALGQIVPAFGSLAVDLAKWTSVVSFVSVQDLLYWGNTVRVATNRTVPVYLLLAACYLALSGAVALVFRAVEYALPVSRARRRSPPPGRSPSAGRSRSPGPVASRRLLPWQGRP
ncbi:MAG: polar amino acid transport system permease protein [Mycobacteriales bacterium]|jgi:polar amino acid transport system permease protein